MSMTSLHVSHVLFMHARCAGADIRRTMCRPHRNLIQKSAVEVSYIVRGHVQASIWNLCWQAWKVDVSFMDPQGDGNETHLRIACP